MTESRGTAIVLGASMGGLLAARTLADFYDKVTIVERDILPDRPVKRRGVAQGRQPHVLLPRASEILDDLFPGFLRELVDGGALSWDDGDLSRMWVSFSGHTLQRSGSIPDPASMPTYFVSRPFLEWSVCQRVRALPAVEILDGHDVVGLTASVSRGRVTGARVVRRGDAETVLTADLVVDATGRGSRAPTFLEELGYGRPAQDELPVHVTYTSFPVHIPAGTLHERLIAIGLEPLRPTAFMMFACENDVYLVGIETIGQQDPPADRSTLLEAAADIAPPHALAAARTAEPLDNVVSYRFPSNRWRRYDKMSRIPAGFFVFGDAICSFNPIYGQGMTIAAIEALVLRDCLRRGKGALPQRFYRASAVEVRMAWQMAVSSDLALPQVRGRRPLSTRILNAFIAQVLTAATNDATVTQAFLRVTGMIDPPHALLRPAIVWRIAKSFTKCNASIKRPVSAVFLRDRAGSSGTAATRGDHASGLGVW